MTAWEWDLGRKHGWMDGQGLLIGVIGVSGARILRYPGHGYMGGYVPGRSDGTRPLLRKLQVELLRSFLLGLEVTRRRPGAAVLFFLCVGEQEPFSMTLVLESGFFPKVNHLKDSRVGMIMAAAVLLQSGLWRACTCAASRCAGM